MKDSYFDLSIDSRLLHNLIRRNGEVPQILSSIGDMSGLIQILTDSMYKTNMTPGIQHKIADALISIYQLILIFDCGSEVITSLKDKNDIMKRMLRAH